MSAYGSCDVCCNDRRFLARCIVAGIETMACDECRGAENVIDDEESVEAFVREGRS